MVALAQEYPLKATTDCRSAMATALATFIQDQVFDLPKSAEKFKIEAVYATWAGFENRAMSSGGALPAAAVLPDRPVYEAAAFGPRIIENTWGGGDPKLLDQYGKQKYPLGDGSGDGFALYTVADLVVPFILIFRAKTVAQRAAIVRTLETLMVEDGSTLPDPSRLDPDVPLMNPEEALQPVRYGRLLEMKNYFNRKVRLTLDTQQLLDNAANASENRWLAQFEITAHAQVCVRRRLKVLKSRTFLVADDVASDPSQPQGGIAIEGLGGWTWAYGGEGAFQNPGWQPVQSYPTSLRKRARLNGLGDYSLDNSTGPLTVAGLGPSRINKAVRGEANNVSFHHNRRFIGDSTAFPNPGNNPIHMRAIVRDPFDQVPNGVTFPGYMQLLDPSFTVFFGLSGVAVGAFGNTEGQINFVVGLESFRADMGQFADQWMLIDAQYTPGPNTPQLFVNGIDFSSVLPPPAGNLPGFTANPAVSIMNSVFEGGLTSALRISIVFAGVAVGRPIDFARHQSDAQALGLL